MDTQSVLSRRSLLKASSFLAVAVAPVCALAAPTVPEVLTSLLAEYAEAAEAVKQRHDRWNKASRERVTALDNAGLWFRWPGGEFRKLGESGRAMHPEYALALLRDEAAKCVAVAEDAETAKEVRAEYAKASRAVRRLRERYNAVEAATDYPVALEANSAAADRFYAALNALSAYRPQTMPEVAAILRCMKEVGQWPGTCTGLTFWNLADMLDEVSK